MTIPIRLLSLTTCVIVATFLASCGDSYSTSPAAGYRSGQEVRDLPQGALAETVNGTRYYSHNGTYFRPDKNRYRVVDPPKDKKGGGPTYVDRLPPGYHMKRYSGEDYFKVGKVWYKQYGAGYVVVDRPF